jgi:putative restriction endonuclease
MPATSLKEFLANQEWDAPFFKRLAHNDTGQAAGHQGGMVLPKDLRQFLPALDEAATSLEAPTTDRYLRAEMFVGAKHLTDSVLRYQLQTWGGTRSAESRITDGFGPLRNQAREGDLLIFQRRADALDRLRLILVKKGTPEFAEAEVWTVGRKWGPLFTAVSPVTVTQITQAKVELAALAEKPFELVRPAIPRLETTQSRIARSAVFRERVRLEYVKRCCVSGIVIASPTGLYEAESAHVVPISEGGSDDIRNGIALAQTLHWAFDRGLIGILPSRKVHIPRAVKRMEENAFLKQFEGKPIAEATSSDLRVHRDALAWHYDNLVRQWD